MAERNSILKMTPERFAATIKRAYELGCNGWMEMSEEIADRLLAECIADLEKVMKNDDKPAPKSKSTSVKGSGPASTRPHPTNQYSRTPERRSVSPDDLEAFPAEDAAGVAVVSTGYQGTCASSSGAAAGVIRYGYGLGYDYGPVSN